MLELDNCAASQQYVIHYQLKGNFVSTGTEKWYTRTRRATRVGTRARREAYLP